MYAKLAALSLGRERKPLSDLHGCQQWWWLCMEVCHLLWELYRKIQVPSSFSHLKKVCIIYRFVKFTTSSLAVTALSVSTVGTVWWQGHYTFTFLLIKIWQLPTYILTFSAFVSVLSKQPKHTSCTWHTHCFHSMILQATCCVSTFPIHTCPSTCDVTHFTRTYSPPFTTWCNWNIIILLNSCQHLILAC